MRVFPAIFCCAVLLCCTRAAFATSVPIEQADHVFSQTRISLTSGDQLVVHNGDGIVHNLTVIDEDGEPQDLGFEPPGKTMNIRFASAGRFIVKCSLTPGMKMYVTVNWGSGSCPSDPELRSCALSSSAWWLPTG